MRKLVFAPLSLLVCAATLTLSGCGGSNTASDPPATGAAPTVAGVGFQTNGVAANRKQEVQFSEAMDPATINAQTFQVADSSGKLTTGTVSYDSEFSVASFQPSPALQPGATYTAKISTAASSAGGVPLAQPYSYTFTTRASSDTSPLGVQSVTPAAGATCVSTTAAITITFDEAPDASTVTPGNFTVTGPAGAIPVKISMNVTTTQVVLTPTSPLPTGNIAVSVNNVADLAGVKMAATYTWSFSTACNGGGGGGTGGTTTQYQAPLFGGSKYAGQVTVDTAGNVTVQTKGATPSQAFTVQFCPVANLKQQNPPCFTIGTVGTDASGNGTLTTMFPKGGPWAGDFQLLNGPVNPSEQGFGYAYGTAYGPGYISTLQPDKTIDEGSHNSDINNAPQAPLKSGTVTYSSSPAPNGSLQFTITGAPPNAPIEAAEGGLVPYDYYAIGGTYTTNSEGDVTFTVPPSGEGGDIFDVGPQNGQAGWEGGFYVPQ
jgi:hypothetical protein